MSILSKARPRIADYPFTTLEPCLGIVSLARGESFVLADIPGLIEGAHQGRGLGDKFLRHVERTRILLHMIDCSATAAEDPAQSYEVIRRELAGYSSDLASRTSLVVATKVEDPESSARAQALCAAIGGPVLSISAATRRGLTALVDALIPFLRESRAQPG